jgi:hypothetical protein
VNNGLEIKIQQSRLVLTGLGVLANIRSDTQEYCELMLQYPAQLCCARRRSRVVD